MTRAYRTTPESFPCDCGDHAFARTSRWGVVLVSIADISLLENYVWTLIIPKPGHAYARSERAAQIIGAKPGYIHHLLIEENGTQIRLAPALMEAA